MATAIRTVEAKRSPMTDVARINDLIDQLHAALDDMSTASRHGDRDTYLEAREVWQGIEGELYGLLPPATTPLGMSK